MAIDPKARVLLVGCGGIGTISALNLETGGKAAVTAVLRSNHDIVTDRGFNIRSIDHGVVNGFKPTTIRKTIPDLSTEDVAPFKYIVIATKNYPDLPPSLPEVIRPAVTPGHSIIVLIQNGLNIEKPFVAAYPKNLILSGVSFCGSHEVGSGEIVHEDNDYLQVGAFDHPAFPKTPADAAGSATDPDKEARDFCAIYAAGGKCVADYRPDVAWTRWRKLLYNACLNPICAVTDLDSGRIQIAEDGDVIRDLVRPAMEEIRAAAKAHGHDLPAELVDFMVTLDPVTMYNPPSMQHDIRKGRFSEFENLVGEPLREGRAKGVPMPTLTVLYNILRAKQWLTKERKGLVTIPEPEDHTVAKK